MNELDVKQTNKQTNKQPESPRLTIRKYLMTRGRQMVAFHLYPDREQDQETYDLLEEWRRKEGKSRADALRFLVAEGVRRHMPGNYQLDIRQWSENLEMSPAAKEKLHAQEAPLETDKITPKPSPNYEAISTEDLIAMYRHPWKLEGFDRQLVGHILKRDRGIDIEKIKRLE